MPIITQEMKRNSHRNVPSMDDANELERKLANRVEDKFFSQILPVQLKKLGAIERMAILGELCEMIDMDGKAKIKSFEIDAMRSTLRNYKPAGDSTGGYAANRRYS